MTLRRLDATGLAQGAPVTLFSGRIHGLDAVRTADGGLLVTSVDWLASPRAVVARRVAPDGTLGATVRVVDAPGSGALVARTALAPTADGGALLAYNGTDQVKLLRLGATGTAVGAPTDLARGRWPDLAQAPSGEYLAVWSSRARRSRPRWCGRSASTPPVRRRGRVRRLGRGHPRRRGLRAGGGRRRHRVGHRPPRARAPPATRSSTGAPSRGGSRSRTWLRGA